MIEMEPVRFHVVPDGEAPGYWPVFSIETGPQWRRPADAGTYETWDVPREIPVWMGSGKRPFLTHGFHWLMDQQDLPIGQRLRVTGTMYQFGPRVEQVGHPHYRWSVMRLAGIETRPANEGIDNLIMVRKIEVLGPGPQRTRTFDTP